MIVDARIVPGQSHVTVKADLDRVLSKFKEEDPNFDYEIVTPVPPEYKVMTEFMNPLDVPKDNVIVQNLEKAYRRVSGRGPDKVGAILTQSYAGNDSCHILGGGDTGVPDGGGRNGRDQKGEARLLRNCAQHGAAGEDVRDGGAGLVQPRRSRRQLAPNWGGVSE